jgi:hypothetical protein
MIYSFSSSDDTLSWSADYRPQWFIIILSGGASSHVVDYHPVQSTKMDNIRPTRSYWVEKKLMYIA